MTSLARRVRRLKKKPKDISATSQKSASRPGTAAGRSDPAFNPPNALDLPGQWPPVDRAYLRPVVGRKARPSRKAGAPPLPTFYPKTSGNYLLELTAFHGGADGG